MNKISAYFRSVYKEIQGITWPNRQRVTTDSSIVIAGLVIGGALIAGIDFSFQQLFAFLIGKIS